MNKKQTKELEALLGILEDACARVGDLLSDCQNRLDAMSERSREGEKGERLDMETPLVFRLQTTVCSLLARDR